METTDPYVTAKSNLRDTVKWLATTLAAFAALVLAGTPFSGFGTLPPGSARFYVALIGLAGASIFLLLVWSTLIHLLRPDAVFASQLRRNYDSVANDPVEKNEIMELREHLAKHRSDLLPEDLNDFDGLENRVEQCWEEASKAGATEAQREPWRGYSANISMIINYAAFERLHKRISKSIPRIILLGGLAIVFLVVFSWASSPGREESSDRVIVLQPFTLPVSGDAGEPSLPRLAPVFFELGKAGVDATGIAAITQVRDFLRSYPDTGVLLMAHTDTLGSATVNRGLAGRRGATVRKVLIEQGGVSSSRIFVADLPETGVPRITLQQVADSDNRTVEFLAVRLPTSK